MGKNGTGGHPRGIAVVAVWQMSVGARWQWLTGKRWEVRSGKHLGQSRGKRSHRVWTGLVGLGRDGVPLLVGWVGWGWLLQITGVVWVETPVSDALPLLSGPRALDPMTLLGGHCLTEPPPKR